MSLSDHLTLAQPLGPNNQSLVKDGRDAVELLDGAPPFLEALRDNATIILGRRGSGKSSVLQGYSGGIRYGQTYGRFHTNAITSHDLVIPLLAVEQFHLMAIRVGRELNLLLKDNPDHDFLFTAVISDTWKFFIWEAIFTNINSARRDGKLTNDEVEALASVFEFFTLSSISSSDQSTPASQRLVANAQSGLLNYLNSCDKICHVLFDNLDDYPIRNPLIESVVSGFLSAVHEVNENFPRINIIICIPEELESYLQRTSANIEKDFTSTHRMRWRPIDLLQIVAYRYQRFIELHDHEFFATIKKLDFTKRKDIVSLFDRILPKTILNSLGYREPALAYIIRHTQLIPRHFIILFNSMLLRTHVHTGGFRAIDEDAVVSGIAEGEKFVAAQILKPFEEIYPKLIRSTRILLGNLPVICEESDLDRINGRFKERVEEDIFDVWSTLYEIGVLGMLDFGDTEIKDEALVPNSDQDAFKGYLYARFHFNSNSAFSKSNRQRYCIHPVFSRFYGLVRDGGSNMMALYPKDIPIVLE